MEAEPAWKASESGFTGLIAWQKAYGLVREVYDRTRVFPSDERFGLTSQIRRAAVSIPSHISEGWSRGSVSDYLRFLHVARGSTSELQTQLWLATDLGYMPPEAEVHPRIEEVQRLLNGLIRSLMEKQS